MQRLRQIHRYITVAIVGFALYLGLTGTMVQLIDFKTLYSHAPATAPDLQAIRESFDGPDDYKVRETRDYDALALPAGSDFPAMFAKVMGSARKDAGPAPLKYVELRMIGTTPVGQVGLGKGHARYDAVTGAMLERTNEDIIEGNPRGSTRNVFKSLHRMTTFGDRALYINVFVSLGLAGLIVTGLWIYAKLWLGRRKLKRNDLFWKGGGTWRVLHRWISLVAAALLVVVTLSGAWLAVESLGLAINMAAVMKASGNHGPGPGGPKGPMRMAPRDYSSPLADAEIPGMLGATLTGLRRDAPNDPVKVIRLRYYAHYAQGVVVTGGDNSQQLVYNAKTGVRMTETEPGYPKVLFPFGWQAHQWAKSVHRGDIIGMPGRWMDLLAGLSLIYLSLSGIVMYWQMWRKRAATGRKGLLWK